jgi:acyl-CoA synthetase (AMP-forming)/AMP-acid ligase II
MVLYEHGIRAGDVIGVQLPNTVELAVVYLVAARLGAIVTPFPVQYREHELRALLPLAEAKAFLTASRVIARQNAVAAIEIADQLPSIEVVFAFGERPPSRCVSLDRDGGASELSQAAFVGAGESRNSGPGDLITIFWTSGTEALPKGIPSTFGDWNVSASTMAEVAAMSTDDVMLCPFPVVNKGGIGGLFSPWMKMGCTLVLHHPFDMQVFLSQIESEQVTYGVVPPAILTRLVQKPHILGTYDLSSVRAFTTGSAPIPASTIRSWEERGVEIINVFASSEGLNLASNRRCIPDPEQRAELFPSYKGHCRPGAPAVAAATEIRLVDLTTGYDIEVPGQVGELLISGPSVFAGYLPGTGKPDPFDDEHFYRSGELFEYVGDDLELLRYHGRSTEMIVRGGFNISPLEIESLLHDHHGITEIAVVGIHDDILGERICAFIVPSGEEPPSLESLTAMLKDRQVAKFKWPEKVEYLKALPRSPVGKVLHRELRKLAQ